MYLLCTTNYKKSKAFVVFVDNRIRLRDGVNI